MSDTTWRLIPDRAEAARAAAEAERDFQARLAVGGLTVTPEAARRWWPLAHMPVGVAA